MTHSVIIEYDENNYEIIATKELNNILFRTIKYSTGFYGLQMYKTDIEYGDNTWQTIYISPKLDKKFKLGEIYEGGYYINCLLSYIEDSVKLHDGENWELKISVPEKDYVPLSETIKREDGESLLNETFKLIKVQQTQMIKYGHDEIIYRWIELILIILLVILIIVWLF